VNIKFTLRGGVRAKKLRIPALRKHSDFEASHLLLGISRRVSVVTVACISVC
jgi:hypothetical protein